MGVGSVCDGCMNLLEVTELAEMADRKAIVNDYPPPAS
jgi:hypothetical protein